MSDIANEIDQFVKNEVEVFLNLLRQGLSNKVGDQAVEVMVDVNYKIALQPRVQVKTTITSGDDALEFPSIDTSEVPRYHWRPHERTYPLDTIVPKSVIATAIKDFRGVDQRKRKVLVRVLERLFLNGNNPISSEELSHLGSLESDLSTWQSCFRYAGLPCTIRMDSTGAVQLFRVSPPRNHK